MNKTEYQSHCIEAVLFHFENELMFTAYCMLGRAECKPCHQLAGKYVHGYKKMWSQHCHACRYEVTSILKVRSNVDLVISSCFRMNAVWDRDLCVLLKSWERNWSMMRAEEERQGGEKHGEGWVEWVSERERERERERRKE